MGRKFEKEYEVHYYEADYNLNCSIGALINYISDIATIQSEQLGVGIDYLSEKNLSWVFYQYDIEINKYPRFGENLKIITDPVGYKKFYALREYEILNESNESLAKCEATFFLIDLEKRRGIRIPQDLVEVYKMGDEDLKNFSIKRLEKLKDHSEEREFSVRYSDIDSNRHVNNARYVEWAIESIPVEIIKEYEIERLQVTFQKECRYGDNVKVLTEIVDEADTIKTLHKIENVEGVELTVLVMHWRKIK